MVFRVPKSFYWGGRSRVFAAFAKGAEELMSTAAPYVVANPEIITYPSIEVIKAPIFGLSEGVQAV